MEFLLGAVREHWALASGNWPPTPKEDEEPTDHRHDCLRRCLAQLPPDQRDLVLRYYQGNSHQGGSYKGNSGQGERNIRNRQQLAREAGIPMNALRIRVHRVRRKLESCVHACLSH